MKPEEQRRALAEWCGWKPEHDEYFVDGIAWWYNGQRWATCDIPDYPNDLNAVHEIEEELTDEQYRQFDYILVQTRNQICLPICRCKSATAAQRCEAILKTLNLWKD